MVVVNVQMEPGEAEDIVAWDSGPNCEPLITDPPSGGVIEPSVTIPSRQLTPLATACPPTKFNWAHSSHTIQDLPGIDLAWLRTSAKRGWRCDTTYWTEVSGDMIARSGSGPSWWSHQMPTWPVINWSCYPIVNLCTQAKMQARAWFRVDFGVCHQDIRIDNEVWTRADGFLNFQTAKSASCTGLHSSTGYKFTASKADGYGGGADDKIATAVPNVSGT